MGFILPNDKSEEVSAWLSERGASLDSAFEWVPAVVPYGGIQNGEIEQSIDFDAPTTSVSMGQLAPLEEKAHYLSPDHPDHGYSRMCDDGLAPLIGGSVHNSNVPEDNTLENMFADMVRHMQVISFEDSFDPSEVTLEMEAELVLYGETDSDDEDYATDEDEDEIDE